MAFTPIEYDKLYAWVRAEIAPICDAEPDPMTRYVMALINKPDKKIADLKPMVEDQLAAFLGTSNEVFVNKLFSLLQSKAYMTKTTSATAEASHNAVHDDPKHETAKNKAPIEAPKPEQAKTEAILPARQEENRRPSDNSRSIRKRISPPPPEHKDNNDRRPRSRSPHRSSFRNRRRSPEYDHRISRKRSRSRSKERRGREERARRPRCKDYDERGMCGEGAGCPFDHGGRPIILDARQTAIGASAAGPVVPGPINFGMPPPYIPPLSCLPQQPPPPGVDGKDVLGDLKTVPVNLPLFNDPAPPLPTNFSMPPPNYMPPSDWKVPPGGNTQSGNDNDRFRNRFRRPFNRATTTLKITSVPRENYTIPAIFEEFSKFGRIRAVELGDKGANNALVTFYARSEAIKAHKCVDPFFNNRFVRVFWFSREEDKPASGEVSSPFERDSSPPAPKKIVTRAEAVFRNKEYEEKLARIRKLAEADRDDQQNIVRETTALTKMSGIVAKLIAQNRHAMDLAKKATDEQKRSKAVQLVKAVQKKLSEILAMQEQSKAKIAKLQDDIAKRVEEREKEKITSSNESDSISTDAQNAEQEEEKDGSESEEPLPPSPVMPRLDIHDSDYDDDEPVNEQEVNQAFARAANGHFNDSEPLKFGSINAIRNQCVVMSGFSKQSFDDIVLHIQELTGEVVAHEFLNDNDDSDVLLQLLTKEKVQQVLRAGTMKYKHSMLFFSPARLNFNPEEGASSSLHDSEPPKKMARPTVY